MDASSILIPIYQAFSPSTSRLAHQIDLIRHIINTVPSTTQLERQLQWPRRRICNTVPLSHGKGENILNAYVSTHSTFFESWYLPFVYQLVSLGRFEHQQTTTICIVTMIRRKGLSHLEYMLVHVHTTTRESSPRLTILPAFLDHLHAVPLLPTCGSLEWCSNGTIFGDGALTNCTGDNNQNLINKAPSGGDDNRGGWSLKKGCGELRVLCRNPTDTNRYPIQ